MLVRPRSILKLLFLSRSHHLTNRVVIFGVIWGMFFLAFATIAEPTPENWALLASITASGLYTVGLYWE
jgi:hypothetical protein